jgi:hypothetical protein
MSAMDRLPQPGVGGLFLPCCDCRFRGSRFARPCEARSSLSSLRGTRQSLVTARHEAVSRHCQERSSLSSLRGTKQSLVTARNEAVSRHSSLRGTRQSLVTARHEAVSVAVRTSLRGTKQSLVTRPSSLITHPSSLVTHPSSLRGTRQSLFSFRCGAGHSPPSRVSRSVSDISCMVTCTTWSGVTVNSS